MTKNYFKRRFNDSNWTSSTIKKKKILYFLCKSANWYRLVPNFEEVNSVIFFNFQLLFWLILSITAGYIYLFIYLFPNPCIRFSFLENRKEVKIALLNYSCYLTQRGMFIATLTLGQLSLCNTFSGQSTFTSIRIQTGWETAPRWSPVNSASWYWCFLLSVLCCVLC